MSVPLGVLVAVLLDLGVAAVDGVLLTRGAGAVVPEVFPGVLIVTLVVFEPPAGVLRVVELPEELEARGAGTVRVVLVVVLRSVVVDAPGTTIVRLTTLGEGATTTTFGVGVGEFSVLTIVVVVLTVSGFRVA